MRKDAFSTLEKLASATKGPVLALGDFNVTQLRMIKKVLLKMPIRIGMYLIEINVQNATEQATGSQENHGVFLM